MSEEIQTKKVQIELEVDTKAVNSGKNPYQKIIHLAAAVDAWRIFPRLFLSVYIFLLYKTVLLPFRILVDHPNFRETAPRSRPKRPRAWRSAPPAV